MAWPLFGSGYNFLKEGISIPKLKIDWSPQSPKILPLPLRGKVK